MESKHDKAKQFIRKNWHKLPKQWNIESMAILMNDYVEYYTNEFNTEILFVLIKNDLPINIISKLTELHKSGGKLLYGTGRFPLGISDSHFSEWDEVFKKVPVEVYKLFF